MESTGVVFVVEVALVTRINYCLADKEFSKIIS